MISVIVPVYNVEKYLDRCLRSILAQPQKDLEIIIVNDGSTDGSLEICKKYKKIDSRITILSKKNGGLSSARNVGIRKAKGEYVMFVDSDDYISDDAVAAFLEELNKVGKRKIDIVVSDSVEEKNGELIYHRHNILDNGRVYSSKNYLIKSIDGGEFYAPVCFNLYRLSFLRENNLFFREGVLHEDMDFLPRSFLAAKSILYVKNDFYHYVVRGNSIMTVGNHMKKMSDLFSIYGDWKKMFDKIKNKKLQKKMMCVLAKYYKASCRQNHFALRKYPKGINGFFLLSNCLNFTELLKTIYFLTFRKLYVMGSF